jgi:predicted transcriptional regulator
MAPVERSPAVGEGLGALRRSGSVTELLFLYACATTEPTQLRPVAEGLGLTVQAASHSYRQLRRRGLVEVRDGRYRPTVEGVAWLHGTLSDLADDVRGRVARLHVIRSTRAVALDRLSAGTPVSLEVREGLLSARAGGGGPSHGVAVRAAAPGALVEVTNLEGILPLEPAVVAVRTVSAADLEDPKLGRRLAAALPAGHELVAAEGLEPYHSLRRVTTRPIVRFAVAAACLEAARLGVPSTLFVTDRDLPRLLAAFAVPRPPPLEVLPLGSGRARPAGGRRSGAERLS